MIKKRIFRVTVALTTKTYAGQRKLAGILRYINGKCNWDIALLRTKDELTPEFIQRHQQETDGYIVSQDESEEVRRTLFALGKPTVFIEPLSKRKPPANAAATVLSFDQKEIGRAAAHHLSGRRLFASFAYVRAEGNPRWSAERETGFCANLERRCPTVPVHAIGSEGVSVEWIRSLPKPTAVFAAFDDIAVAVVETCRAADVKVPDEAMILGAGDDNQLCLCCNPSLSSVSIPFEEHGYLAAQELQTMLMSRSPRARVLSMSFNHTISQRRSTTAAPSVHPFVRDGLAYINANALNGIKVPDVVATLHVSRRLADLRFRQATGKSLLQLITDVQIKEAKKLLADTDLSISAVALKCGFKSSNYFKNVFVKSAGLPPRAWRSAYGSAASGTKRKHLGKPAASGICQ